MPVPAEFTPWYAGLTSIVAQTPSLPAADLAARVAAHLTSYTPAPLATARQLLDLVWLALITFLRADGAHNDKLADFLPLFWARLRADHAADWRMDEMTPFDELDWFLGDSALGGPCEGGEACLGKHTTDADGAEACDEDQTLSLGGTFAQRRQAWVAYIDFCAALQARGLLVTRGLLHMAGAGVLEGATKNCDYRGSNVLALERALVRCGDLLWEQGATWWGAEKGVGVEGEERVARWRAWEERVRGIEQGGEEEDDEVKEGAARVRRLLEGVRERHAKE